MDLGKVVQTHEDWEEHLNSNHYTLSKVLNLNNPLADRFRSSKLITRNEFEDITSEPEAKLGNRFRKFMDLLHNGPDRFATKQKLTTLVTILEHADFSRPGAAKIFDEFLVTHFGGREKLVEEGKPEGGENQRSEASGAGGVVIKLGANGKVNNINYGDVTYQDVVNFN